MIHSKEELQFYLDADKFALGIQKKKPSFFGNPIWKFQIALRKCEYYNNKNSIVDKIMLKKHRFLKNKLGQRLGFDIKEGVFGAGLRINHFGNIVAGGKVGRWCDIHQGVNIGQTNPTKRIKGEKYNPTIGDNVWIGPGVKIYGNINIGSQVQIGANAVVGKSFDENVTIAGVPAKIIRNIGTAGVDVSSSVNRSRNFFIKHPNHIKFNTTSS